MKGDFSSLNYNVKNHYASVRMQQGRVQIDSDWNEQMDIFDHRVKTETIDFIGGSGAPVDNAGFEITVDNNNWSIHTGRYYVDGLLCELETVQTFNNQADYPNATLPVTDGVYLAYLDVWQRNITSVDDASITEVALNGADTTTRLKNIAQVKWLSLDVTDVVTSTCSNLFDANAQPGTAAYNNNLAWQQLTAQSTGQLIPAINASANFDNQLYRIEIHQAGDLPTATFKWSRDNASLAASIQTIQGNTITLDGNSSQLSQFAIGQWIEVSSNARELNGDVGLFAHITDINDNIFSVAWADAEINTITDLNELNHFRVWEKTPVKLLSTTETYSTQSITAVNPSQSDSDITIILTDTIPEDVAVNQYLELTNTTYIENKQTGVIAPIKTINRTTNTLTINAISSNWQALDLTLVKFIDCDANTTDTSNFIALENGLCVEFSDGRYKTGDYWLITARSNTNNIEWPIDENNQFIAQSAFGITHAYSKLSLLQLQNQQWSVLDDCRTIFNSLTGIYPLFNAVVADVDSPHASIYIDDLGHVGIGTGENTPVSELQVNGTTTVETIQVNQAISGTDVIDTLQIKDHSVTAIKLGTDVILSAVPTGMILPFTASTPPNDWLPCDGSAVSRDTYATLFNVIGTTYGAGDGATTFNVPDLRGRTIICSGQGDGLTNRNIGDRDGYETVTLTSGQMPSHTHTYVDTYFSEHWGNDHSFGPLAGSADSDTDNYGYTYTRTSNPTGSNQPHSNMQPYFALLYCIKC